MSCRIDSLITESSASMDQHETVQRAVAFMAEQDVGSLIVTDGDDVLGVFTERDLITRVVGPGKNPSEVKLGDVCTRRLISISSDSSCQEAISKMEKHNCRRLIVYRGERYQGLLNLTDVAGAMAKDRSRNNSMVNVVAGMSLAAIIVVIALLLYNLPGIIKFASLAIRE